MAKLKVKNPNAVVTNKTLYEAVDTLLDGMDNMLDEQKKIFATKEDLKREVSWIRDDIKGLTADLSEKASKADLNKLHSKVDKYLQTN
jgi:hypothetical protein